MTKLQNNGFSALAQKRLVSVKIRRNLDFSLNLGIRSAREMRRPTGSPRTRQANFKFKNFRRGYGLVGDQINFWTSWLQPKFDRSGRAVVGESGNFKLTATIKNLGILILRDGQGAPSRAGQIKFI